MAEPSAEVKAMSAEAKELVHAAFLDLCQTWASLTEAWLLEEASRQIAGAKPTGSPGMFLNGYLDKAGLLPKQE